ncbi:MAG: type 4a pilus biogenesis protein PilO [Candidatus Omnitrophota bacterium]|nr:MAG: type 4a pilus biogenesis protein PilO [Candidatus Omnitrophota bacterium]
MNITSHRKGTIIFILILFLAFRIGYGGIYKSNLKKIESVKSQIEEEKKKNEVLGIISLLERKIKAHQERSFSVAEGTQILDRISRMAERLGIKIEAFNPLSAEEKEYYVELPLKIPFSCDYHQLGEFLSLIESSKEFIRVKELRMRKPTVAALGEAKIPEVELTVSGFYLKK